MLVLNSNQSIDLDEFGVKSYGQERYIALEDGLGNSYGKSTQDIQVEQQAAEQEALEEQAAQEIVASTTVGLTPLGYLI